MTVMNLGAFRLTVKCSVCGAELSATSDGKEWRLVVEPCIYCLQAARVGKDARLLNELCNTIEAHDIESISCDRDGEQYCECLREKVAQIRKAQKAKKGEGK